MESTDPCPARQQIRPTSPELSRRAPRQHDAKAFVAIDDRLDLVEQPGQLLNLIDRENLLATGERLPQRLGVGAHSAEGVGLQEIDIPSLGEPQAQQGALPGLTWTEQEERPVPQEAREVQDAVIHRRDGTT